MSWTARERAMLREMGIAWPQEPQAREPEAVRVAAVVAPSATVTEAPLEPGPAPAPAPAPARGSASAPPLAPVAAARQGAEGSDARATMDWTALQADVAACTRCGLCGTRGRTVFGVGQAPSDWMIVGEAPGEHEDRQGEPFVGAAGQLLDRMLAAIGLARGQGVFITNTVKCRPPQNRNPQPEELHACAPVLHRQIELVRPRLVLAMGRFAAQQLLGSDLAIGRLRGQVHRLPSHPQVAVVVTYHPAYLLRNPADKGKAWADLCLALDAMNGNAPDTAP